jgi:heme A synthase
LSPEGLSRFAFWALLYNLAVIVWGAYVRASGSGAGCGSHWPLCNGQVLPLEAGVRTWIEFGHRASSGLSLILSAVIAYWGWNAFPGRHPARRAAMRVLIFTLTEALIGAGLVLLGLVEKDQSLLRAVSISLHYANTLLLLGSLVQTVWRARLRVQARPRVIQWSAVSGWRIAIAGVFLTGATGAITALGDTLFPASSVLNGMHSEFAAQAPQVLALRIYHPILAVSFAAYLLWFLDARVGLRFDDRVGQKLKRWLSAVVVFQLLLGVTNIVLLAPTTIQLVHLLTAQTLWILLISLREKWQGPRS